MKQLIIAGAEGYLGSYLVKESLKGGYQVKVISGNPGMRNLPGWDEAQIFPADVTKTETLEGLFDKKDVLILRDTGFRANLNLLNEAKRAGVGRMIYVSSPKIMQVKEAFTDELKASEMECLVIRPNAFFSQMKYFLDMAKHGRVFLFGHGNYKLNPIHGKDLAHFILDHIDESGRELEAGGPDILTQNEIARLALETHHKPSNIIHLPEWTRKFTVSLLKTFTFSKTYDPFEYYVSMMGRDNISPRSGVHHLKSFFFDQVDHIRREPVME